MKKIITTFAAIAMLAVSCQQENITINDKDTGITTGKLTATMMPKTKVSYTYMDYDDDWNWNYDWDEDTYAFGLLPAWEIGDEIIGFDNSGNTYTLTVDSTDADGVATLSGTVPDGDLHLIYKYGAEASDISNKTLTVDYSDQAGDVKSMPAVMLADGTVENGGGNFTFTNAGAIIWIYDQEGLPADSKVTNITISGKNLSQAIIALDGSNKLTLTATGNTDDAITLHGLDLTAIEEMVEKEDQPGSYYWSKHLSRPFWIAVPDGAVIEKISVDYLNAKPTPVTDPAKEGADYVTIAGKKWAKWNIGAVNEKDYGWYFYWGGMEKCWRHQYWNLEYHEYKDAWWKLPSTTSYDFVYDIGYEYTACASTYIECRPEFETTYTEDYCEFEWEYTPFNNGMAENPDLTYFGGIIDTVCPIDGDGYRTLLPEYDAAHVNWGGTWRMPTWDDFNSLIVACGGTPISNPSLEETEVSPYTPAELSSANPGKGIYWVSAEQTLIADYTGVEGVLFCDGTSKLFFPAAGSGNNNNLSNYSIEGNYWTSNLSSATSGFGNARALHFVRNELIVDKNKRRSFGFPIRPVSELSFD